MPGTLPDIDAVALLKVIFRSVNVSAQVALQQQVGPDITLAGNGCTVIEHRHGTVATIGYSRQIAQVNTHLHGRRTRQNVDFVRLEVRLQRP